MVEFVESVVLVLVLDLASEVGELDEVGGDVGDFGEVGSDLRDVEIHQVRVVAVEFLHLLVRKSSCLPVVLDVDSFVRRSH